MRTLVCLGLGYCARHYVAEFGQRFGRIAGTARSAERAATLATCRFGGRPVEMLVFDGQSAPAQSQRMRQNTFEPDAARAIFSTSASQSTAKRRMPIA